MERPLENLKLIAYDAKKMGNLVSDGAYGNWFMAEQCARHVCVTTDPDAKIPEPLSVEENITLDEHMKINPSRIPSMVLEGEEAYTYLLMVATGLLEKHRGDEHVKSEMAKCFHSWRDGNQEVPSDLTHLMQEVFNDTKSIRKMALQNLASYTNEPTTIARKMLDMKTDDEGAILVIGDKNEATARVCRNLGRYCSKIYLTNPAGKHALDENYQAIELDIRDKKVSVDVEKVSSDEINQELFSNVRHIFCCNAMGSHQDFEQRLISDWRSNDNISSMVHLRGVPQERGRTNDTWGQLKGMPDFIDREMIDAQHQENLAANKEVIAYALNACHNCANTRSLGNGKKPVLNFITLPPEEYAHRTSSRSCPIRNILST